MSRHKFFAYAAPPRSYGFQDRYFAELYDVALEAQTARLQAGRQAPISTDDVKPIFGGSMEAFHSSRMDPSRLPGSPGHYPNQVYRQPTLAVIKKGEENVIGYGYASENVSGTPARRMIKGLLGRPPYVNIREIYCREEAPEGTVEAIGQLLLDGYNKSYPATTFTFKSAPEEAALAESLGLSYARDLPEEDYGSSLGPQVLQRWKGTVAHTLDMVGGSLEGQSILRQSVIYKA